MNLLIVTGIFPPDRGGPASYVPRIASALVERGHRVEVICLSDRVDHPDIDYPFRVTRIRRGLFWPWRVLKTVAAIWSGARRNELIYVNGLGAESALAALLAGRPAVHKIVGDYAWERAVGRGWFRGTIDEYQTCAKRPLLHLIDAIRSVPLKLATQVIVPSRYLQKLVSGWGIDAQRVAVIYNAVVPGNSAEPMVEQLPPWSGKTLITVCRLVPWKGLDGLIQLLARCPETRLVIAGDGSMRRELELIAQSCGVADRLRLLGDVPHASVRGYLQQADAFVLNSSYEGLPHVVLEAMSACLPVIATAVGGTPEVVEDGSSGLLVPAGDTEALRVAVNRLWNEPGLAKRLVAGASAKLTGPFGFDSMVGATEAILLGAIHPARQSLPITRGNLQ
ncbi:MAG: glycosyltransferase family 4 protein [Verrucomicrobiota bacterium]